MLRRSITIKKALFAYLILAIFFVAIANVEFVRKRIMNDLKGVKLTDQIALMAEGNWDDLPLQSAGVRVHSWLEASTWIAENPILGTDYSSVSLVPRTSEKFHASERWRDLGHLHNFYLETLVAYGLVGLIFISLFYREIIKNVLSHKTYREHVLLLSFLLFWAIINCFESFNDKILGLYAQNIVLAGLYTYRKPRIN